MGKYSFETSKRKRRVVQVINRIKTFHSNRRNTIFLIISIFFAVILLKSETFYNIVAFLGNFGIISAFILGFLFSFGFLTAPTSATFYLLAEHINPFLMAFIASLGAMIGNFLIFNFVKYKLIDEIRFIFSRDLRLEFSKFEIIITKKMIKSKAFRNVFPALSGILVSLPLPTEMFVSILWNIAKYDNRKVLLFSYIFSFIGILFLGLLQIL